ncbi:FkbM family methyltransferase [Rhizorhabdus sp.]|uniref:FkbM family methyltransferase n=1 Tax=Rhizorhabdus sp. TaxID=1968843 RepID=UPI0019B100EB|nr:FkbM family methyltransferase [Rhizorhabdus sp.]MBD3760747.1 FkbM family methyltransferase [Rhizorhabdus sp.]
MSWRTNPLMLAARNVARALKLTDLIAAIGAGRGYEERYDRLFSNALRQGDCVWDIGANIGYYSSIFADRVGRDGSVHAFEPSPANFARLRAAIAGRAHIHARQLALGDAPASLPFEQGSDDLGATSRIVADAGETALLVPVQRGDTLVAEGELPQPNAIKVDVEGFEPEVFAGLGDILTSPALRLVGVEVHFRLLNERGHPDGAAQIEKLLTASGLDVSWPDFSHIVAIRR